MENWRNFVNYESPSGDFEYFYYEEKQTVLLVYWEDDKRTREISMSAEKFDELISFLKKLK